MWNVRPVRPRFELQTSLSLTEVRSRVRDALACDGGIDGMVLDQRFELVCSPDVHFWSPQLAVDLATSAGGTSLSARFGPHPHVWTLYVAIHAIGAMTTLGAAIFGLSQHLAGQSPWALWVLPASPFLAALVWATAFVGQHLGAEQMIDLRRFLEEAVKKPSLCE